MQKSKKIIIISSAIVIVLIAVLVIFIIINKKSNGNIPQAEDKTAQEGIGEEEITGENNVWAKDADFEKIAKDIEKKKSVNEVDAEDLIQLGVSYYNMNELDKAAEAYKTAITKDPKNALAYSNLGNVLRDKNDYRGAEEQYRKAISISPEFTSAYVALAVMFRALEDNKPAALKVLNEGLAKNPGNGILQGLLDDYKKT